MDATSKGLEGVAGFESAPAVRETRSAAGGLSWFCKATVVGATSIVVGILWDISWHRTIGRDTFWTPAHLAIHFGGLLAGFTAGWLILQSTFGSNRADREASVGCLGFRGPLGAWVIVWGALAMLTSAPFDDWWHNAYGLDVEILSPPHMVLAMGMYGVVGGALMLVLREQNRRSPGETAPGAWAFAYISGVFLVLLATMVIEHGMPNHQHMGRFYLIACAIYPLLVLGLGRASSLRFGCTAVAGFYMLVSAAMTWILPLFEARPLLGPIYNPVDRMVPLPFPLLLVVPAVALDLAKGSMGAGRGFWRDTLLALVCGSLFFALFLVVQWNFSRFLLTPAAENWFFAANRWEYNFQVGDWTRRFWDETNPRANPPATVRSLGLALLFSVISCRLALGFGGWLTKVRR